MPTEVMLFAVDESLERRGVGSGLFRSVRGWAAARRVPLYVLSAERASHADETNWWVRALRRAGLGGAWRGCNSQAEP